MSKIGKLRADYNNLEDCDFLGSPQDYVNIATRTIQKYGGSYTKELLKSEDAISNIATHIMYGDWRWDSSRDGGSSQDSYRIECAKWAIRKYMSRKKGHTVKPKTFSIDNLATANHSYAGNIADGKTTDIDLLEQQDLIDNILNTDKISTIEKQYITEYYIDRKTYREIALANNVTFQRVHQIVRDGINKLRAMHNEY